MSTKLDQVLSEAKLSNHDVVAAAAPAQLSHKNVQKARTGSRPVSDAVARTITTALNNHLQPDPLYRVIDLFPGYPRGRATVAAAGESVQD